MNRRWLGPVVIVAMVVFAVAAFPSLPRQIPSHWNLAGEVDAWMNRWPGAFVFPLAGLAVWLLIVLLRKIDPRRANYERFEDTFWVFVNLLVLFLAVMEVLTLGHALGWSIDMTRAVLMLLGLLFAGMGHYLPRIRSNWWMGIRTPWTLESDRVWRETHRVGGRAFVIGGLAAMAAALLPTRVAFWGAISALTLAAVVPVVYSYLLWRRAET